MIRFDPASSAESLIRFYASADESVRDIGRAWYPSASRSVRSMARRAGITPVRAAGIVAAVSPRIQWSRNIETAERIARTVLAGGRPPFGICLGLSESNATRILLGEAPGSVLRGPKTAAFYRNLRGDTSTVTIDVWAARAAGYPSDAVRPNVYTLIADAYRIAAEHVGEAPSALQAIVWTVIRGRPD